jgi:hypothetical protein
VQGALLIPAGAAARGLCALAGAALLVAAPPALAPTAEVTIEVPPGKTRSVRLRNLPLGTEVSVTVRATGKLLFALVSAGQLKSPRPKALFRGALERRISFRVVIPETSDYYLVLDNRRSAQAVEATATIRAQQRAAPPSEDGMKRMRLPYSPRPENASTSPR